MLNPIHRTTALRRHALAALALAVATLALAPSPAEAHPRSRARVGVWIGGPLWWPGYWGPWGPGYYNYSPVIVQQPAEPTVVIPATAQQTHYWYYCREAQMYYPYVTSCPSPWQEVLATADTPAVAAPASAPVPATRSGTPVPRN